LGLSVSGWDSDVSGGSEEKEFSIAGVSSHGLRLKWSWLTSEPERQHYRLEDEHIVSTSLTFTPTAYLEIRGQ
jgi:hypothetical protein